MKEENLMVVWSLLIVALSSFGAIVLVVIKGGPESILNQLVLIPVSVVSVFGGYLTKSLADKVKEWKAKDDPAAPKPE